MWKNYLNLQKSIRKEYETSFRGRLYEEIPDVLPAGPSKEHTEPFPDLKWPSFSHFLDKRIICLDYK